MLSICIIAAVNNTVVLEQNLLESPDIRSGNVKFTGIWNAPTAGSAYNCGLQATISDIAIFAHQDVYLPEGWFEQLSSCLEILERRDPNWAIAGPIGITAQSRPIGRVWSSGLVRELGTRFADPVPVVSLDEMLLVLRRASDLQFDEHLPGFHLYGTDICLAAHQRGLRAYALHLPAVHNSVPVRSLCGPYLRAYRYMKRKWRHKLPAPTLIAPITRFELGFWRAEWRRALHAQSRREGATRPNPREIAVRLGYELSSTVPDPDATAACSTR